MAQNQQQHAVQLVESVLANQFGERPFKHTDVVDMTLRAWVE
jgi:hypothetical protein